jgi:hypothetical protein
MGVKLFLHIKERTQIVWEKGSEENPGPEGDDKIGERRKVHGGERSTLYAPNIIRMTKPKRKT